MASFTASGRHRSNTERRRPRVLRNGMLTVSRKHDVLIIGESLRLTLHESEMIKDRRYHLRNYARCFVGRDVVDWLLERGEADTRQQAINIMRNLEEYNIIHHVVDDHSFKDEFLFYRFRRDDGTYEEEPSPDDQAAGQRLYSRLSAPRHSLIQDRKYHGRTYHSCVVGNELVDFLIAEGLFGTRHEAVAHLRDLVEAGVLHHVCHDHHFKDEYLFYRFINDEKRKESKKSGGSDTSSSLSPVPGQSTGSSSRSPVLFRQGTANRSASDHQSPGVNSGDPSSPLSPLREQNWKGAEGISVRQAYPSSPPSLANGSVRPLISPQGSLGYLSSPPTDPASVRSPEPPPSLPFPNSDGRHVVASVTAAGTPPEFIYHVTVEELLEADSGYVKRHVCVVSDPVGFGFVIRGVAPVHVHTVDPTGPAATSGLKVGDFLINVNGQDVLRSTHVEVAKMIVRGSAVAKLVVLTHPAMA